MSESGTTLKFRPRIRISMAIVQDGVQVFAGPRQWGHIESLVQGAGLRKDLYLADDFEASATPLKHP